MQPVERARDHLSNEIRSETVAESYFHLCRTNHKLRHNDLIHIKQCFAMPRTHAHTDTAQMNVRAEHQQCGICRVYCLTAVRASVFPLRFTGMHLICGCVDMERSHFDSVREMDEYGAMQGRPDAHTHTHTFAS